MVYATIRGTIGRRPVQIVEMDLDYCNLSYGVAPCGAAIGVTGTVKCFNTRQTCQNPPNYTPGSVSTWNPADQDASILLSNGNMTMTAVIAGRSMRGTIGRTGGKWYFEYTATNAGSIIGMARSNASLVSYPGNSSDSFGYDGANSGGLGNARRNAASIAFGSPWGAGAVLGLYVDAAAGTIGLIINGVDQGVAYAGLGVGPWFPFLGGAAGAIGTANFGGTLFAYFPPAGYQAWGNYNKTYRFSTLNLQAPALFDSTIYPFIQSVKITPAKIDLQKGTGLRAAVTIVIQDAPDDDLISDKYIAGRTYTPNKQGTLWGKLISRNPFYQNRPLRVKSGYLNQDGTVDLTNFETRYYIIDHITGPDAKGIVTIIGRDTLKKLDDVRAVYPAANTGSCNASVATGDLTLTLQPAGIGNVQYPANGVAQIGNEVVSFTRAGDVLTITRAQQRTIVASHAQGDLVQVGVVFTAANPATAIQTLMLAGGLTAGQLDYANWLTEISVWMSGYSVTATLFKPTGITSLIQEICIQCTLYVWWDERNQLVKLAVIRPPRGSGYPAVDETSNVLADSLKIAYDPPSRVTEVWIYYGIVDPTKGYADPTNFAQLYIKVDTNAEGANQYGDVRIKTIFARWIAPGSTSLAAFLANRILNRYRNIPWKVTFDMDAKDQGTWLGDVVTLNTVQFQDTDGSSPSVNVVVTAVDEKVPGTTYAYEAVSALFYGRYAFITPNGYPVYSSASNVQRSNYGFISNNTPAMSDVSSAYKIV